MQPLAIHVPHYLEVNVAEVLSKTREKERDNKYSFSLVVYKFLNSALFFLPLNPLLSGDLLLLPVYVCLRKYLPTIFNVAAFKHQSGQYEQTLRLLYTNALAYYPNV